MVVLDAAFHVLQLIQHGEHVDELPEGQQVRLGDEVFPALGVTQTTDFPAEAIDCSTLGERKTRGVNERFFRNLAFVQQTASADAERALPGST